MELQRHSSYQKPSMNLFLDCEWSSLGILLTCQILYVYYDDHGVKQLFVVIYYNNTLSKDNEILCPMPMINPDGMVAQANTIFRAIPTEGKTIMEDYFQKLESALELASMPERVDRKTIPEMDIRIHFFFAFKDLEYFFEFKTLQPFLRETFPPKNKKGINFLVQQKILHGRFQIKVNEIDLSFRLVDQSGWGKGSLEAHLNMLNIPYTMKNNQFINKSHMEDSYQKHNQEFIEYALEDVITLSQIPDKRWFMINQILKEAYHFPQNLLFQNAPELPLTTGRLTATIFEKYLEHSFGEKWEVFLQISNQMGLDPNKLCGKNAFQKNNSRDRELSKGVSNLLNGASISSIAMLHQNNSGLLNVLIQGGRCSNEQRNKFYQFCIADIDITGCYGNSLTKYRYPIELPYTYARTKDCPTITLKSFLDQYEPELVDNLFVIMVSGQFSFEQNLIHSKIVDINTLYDRMRSLIANSEEDEIDVEKNDFASDFVMMLSEIENGILTSDTLEVLKKVCSNQEYSEILNLEVQTASMYRKSDWVPLDQYVEEITKNPGTYIYNTESQSNNDTRSRKWTTINLKDFIQPLLDQRAGLKKNMKTLKNDCKELEKDPVKNREKIQEIKNQIDQLKAQDTAIKLIINSVYGVFCSSYFSVGNAILANNITARARIGVWMISRAVKGFQSITDGCAYSLQDVLSLRPNFRHKPSLATLSDLKKLSEHRYIQKQPLGGRNDWEELIQTDKIPNDVDAIVKNHIDQFWKNYDLQFPYDVEHKAEHFGSKIIYLKQAHYGILRADGNIVFKCRNVHRTEDVNDPKTSTFQFLMETGLQENRLSEVCWLQKFHEDHRLATLFDYFLSWKKIIKGKDVQSVRPGDQIVESRDFIFSYKEFPVLDKIMYNKIRRSKQDFACYLFPWLLKVEDPKKQ